MSNWGIERLGNFPEVTQLPGDGADIWLCTVMILEPVLLLTASTINKQPCIFRSHFQAALS